MLKGYHDMTAVEVTCVDDYVVNNQVAGCGNVGVIYQHTKMAAIKQ